MVYLRLFVLLVIADSKHHYLDNMSPDSKFEIAPTTQRSSSNHSGRCWTDVIFVFWKTRELIFTRLILSYLISVRLIFSGHFLSRLIVSRLVLSSSISWFFPQKCQKRKEGSSTLPDFCQNCLTQSVAAGFWLPVCAMNELLDYQTITQLTVISSCPFLTHLYYSFGILRK